MFFGRGSVRQGCVWSEKCPSGKFLVGEISVGEVPVGEMSVGEVSVGDGSVGELSGHLIQDPCAFHLVDTPLCGLILTASKD